MLEQARGTEKDQQVHAEGVSTTGSSRSASPERDMATMRAHSPEHLVDGGNTTLAADEKHMYK